ncbi:FkbM family methyltransferase [Seonamhaeicola sp. MEBiC1930]|uniref:FkbM family methyltransferase n=1 Tax=Seonamhaeicola sp. MEBiC01930 TaxID=2976768 RepID=UPI0032484E5F
MINRIFERFCVKHAKRFFNKIKGQKQYQALFEDLHHISLQGMNIGGWTNTSNSGEKNALHYVFDKLKERDNLTLFDVGANIGNYSFLMGEVFNKNHKIFSFEPSKSTFEKLAQSTQQLENISLFNFGFGDKNTSLTLFSNKEMSGLASLYNRRLDHFNISMDIKEEIKIKTIDSFCAENDITQIDFLKLDIEGNELKALNGAKKMLDGHKVDFIQFEFGGCNIDSRTYFQDFYYLLKEDYYIYRIVKDGLYKINHYKEIYEAFTTTNYLAERVVK